MKIISATVYILKIALKYTNKKSMICLNCDSFVWQKGTSKFTVLPRKFNKKMKKKIRGGEGEGSFFSRGGFHLGGRWCHPPE